MTINEFYNLLGMIAAYFLSFTVAAIIVIGLPLFGIGGMLRLFTSRNYRAMNMKKHTGIWLIIWLCVVLIVSVIFTVASAAQELTPREDTQRDTIMVQCPCDSAFVRYARFRFERNTDQTVLIMNALKDHAQAYYVLQRRVDSLRSVIQKIPQSKIRKK